MLMSTPVAFPVFTNSKAKPVMQSNAHDERFQPMIGSSAGILIHAGLVKGGRARAAEVVLITDGHQGFVIVSSEPQLRRTI